MVSTKDSELTQRRLNQIFDITNQTDNCAGRRLRAISAMWRAIAYSNEIEIAWNFPQLGNSNKFFAKYSYPPTYYEFAKKIETLKKYKSIRNQLAHLPLRTSGAIVRTLGQLDTTSSRDPELMPCLQDIGYEIFEDLKEACEAFDDPELWYPGVDEGIEPVPDEHVELVIAAMQRELNRELRASVVTSKPLPPAPLAELPWRIKRAFVERRRFRFLEFGITKENWEKNEFSIWDIPEDPDWRPRRQTRIRAEKGITNQEISNIPTAWGYFS